MQPLCGVLEKNGQGKGMHFLEVFLGMLEPAPKYPLLHDPASVAGSSHVLSGCRSGIQKMPSSLSQLHQGSIAGHLSAASQRTLSARTGCLTPATETGPGGWAQVFRAPP